MDWKDIITQKNLHYHRFSSLIILIIAVMIIMISVIIPFITGLIPKDYHIAAKIGLFLIAEGILISHWYYYRMIFPKGKKDIQYIVVAIVTENQKQKERISNDFVNNLRRLLIEYQLHNNYDIVVLHNAHSNNLKRIIEDAFLRTKKEKHNIQEVNRFNAVNNRMNAKFIVFGNLISRDAPKNKYILNIEALIRHRDAPAVRKEIQNDFQAVWQREISFLEENESTEFKSTSKQIFFAAAYMLGLATIVDFNHIKGIEIGNKLLEYIKANEKYKEFEPKVIKMLSLSYFLFSRVHSYLGDYEKSTFYRRKYHELVKDDYDTYLSEAIFQVNRRKDPEAALELIEKAKKISKGNGTWRYSKLYLLIRLNRHKDALKTLDEILSSNYKEELDTISQVINYNFNCLKEDPCHIQSLFIIGVLMFKKLNNAPSAYDKIDEFLVKTKNLNEWILLHNRARRYMKEINKIMEIKEG